MYVNIRIHIKHIKISKLSVEGGYNDSRKIGTKVCHELINIINLTLQN